MRRSNGARYFVDADVIHVNVTSLAVTQTDSPNTWLSIYHLSNAEKQISAILN